MLQVLGDKAKAGILTIPALQDVLRRAVNLRSDLLDQLDQRMESIARRLNLATRKETKALRRQIRELENQVQGLEGHLSHERQRAERAEGSLTDALKAAREADAKLRKLTEQKLEPKPEAKPEVEAIEAKPDNDDGEKATSKRSSRAKKKAEPDEGA